MCVNTLSALKVGTKENGKSIIKIVKNSRKTDFNTAIGSGIEFYTLPCGNCIECRLARSRVWALRCMHEASLHENNCFITLTFNEDNINPIMSLDKSIFQKFIKRLRKFLDWYYWCPITNEWEKLKIPFSEMCNKKYSGVEDDEGQTEVAQKVRFFHAGEYGETFSRPHHHAIIFGFDFPDKIFKIRKKGFDYYESPLLEKLWSDPKTKESLGFHEITSVSMDTCAYVARYVTKKVNGEGINRDGKLISEEEHYSIADEQGNIYKREKEFSTMSRRPGIGLGWYKKYKDSDVWLHDRVHIEKDVFVTPPRYYTTKLEEENPEIYKKIKEKRKLKAAERKENTTEKQRSREAIIKSRTSVLRRELI